MKNTPHPNMWPSAGETMAVPAQADAKPVTNESPAHESSLPSSPWANPVERLQSAVGTKPPAETPAPKEKRISRSEQAIEHLRAHGPSTSAELCAALGIESKGGITPFIASGLRSGAIVRDGGRYALPGQFQPTLTTRVVAVEAPAKPETPPTSVAAAEAAPARAIAQERKPDFTLSAGDALVIAWPDGAVTVQRGGVFVELTAHQARLFRVFVELRQ